MNGKTWWRLNKGGSRESGEIWSESDTFGWWGQWDLIDWMWESIRDDHCFFLKQKVVGLLHQLIGGILLVECSGSGQDIFYLHLIAPLSTLPNFVLCPRKLTSVELLTWSLAIYFSRYVQLIGNTKRFKDRRSCFKLILLQQGLSSCQLAFSISLTLSAHSPHPAPQKSCFLPLLLYLQGKWDNTLLALKYRAILCGLPTPRK